MDSVYTGASIWKDYVIILNDKRQLLDFKEGRAAFPLLMHKKNSDLAFSYSSTALVQAVKLNLSFLFYGASKRYINDVRGEKQT